MVPKFVDLIERYESCIMEVDEIQRQVCKFQRIGNGRSSSSNGTNHDASKVVQKGEVNHHHGRYHPDDEEDGVLVKRSSSTGGGLAGGIDILSGGGGRLCGWPSSRIVRVSRASGGKDRHSKVLTSKGLRDRRVRLSVTTAIQFYDLQDRLGYDQPSKAVEWLLKAASSSIAELPSLNPAFPDTPKQLSDEKRSSENTEPGFESAEVELDGDPNFQHHQQGQNVSLSKSACSSTSETSKGSGLSLSRSESRIKARERARERAAEKEKEKENDSQHGVVNHQNVSPISQNSSFTELLTAGISSVGGSNSSPNGSAHQNSSGGGGTGGKSSLINKSRGQWTPPMDYLPTGIFAPLSSRGQTSSGFPGHIQLGNSLPQFNITTTTGDHHPELQHFSFVPENFVPVATTASGNSESYNLNFSISSSGLAGFNRGTLQSNSPSLLPPHLQRFPSIDGSNLPFFIGSSTTAASNATAPVENHHHNQHHQFPAGFDAGLQLCYGDNPAGSHSDHKGKGKN